MADIIRPSWIAVDWGTTHMRAYAMGAQRNEVLARAHGSGMRALAGGDFEAALVQAVGTWLAAAAAPLPVVLCGMVGSRQGWQEAKYLPVPQDLDDLGNSLSAVRTQDRRIEAYIVPGLSQVDPYDVMRGEESQLAGYVAQISAPHSSSQRVCLPGTHAKWARLDNNRVVHFSTALTGELFDLISNQSILAHSVAGSTLDQEAFGDSVRAAYHAPACLTEALFSIRAEGLLGGEDSARARGRLSGLLIGAELAGAHLRADEPIALIGAPNLCRSYATALSLIGFDASLYDGEAMVLAGLSAIHDQLTANDPSSDTQRYEVSS